ncbi:MAG TPA: hypothetical protein VGG10_17875 [Rhizomicrobium sp.]
MKGMDLGYLGWHETEPVAKCVVDGIKANRLYIFSHAAGRVTNEQRFQATFEDFKSAP